MLIFVAWLRNICGNDIFFFALLNPNCTLNGCYVLFICCVFGWLDFITFIGTTVGLVVGVVCCGVPDNSDVNMPKPSFICDCLVGGCGCCGRRCCCCCSCDRGEGSAASIGKGR